MLDLFAMEVVIKNEMLVSVDERQYHKLAIKESTGHYPFQVSVVSGSGSNVHGKQSYSFQTLNDAEKRFSSFLTSYQEEGFQKSLS